MYDLPQRGEIFLAKIAGNYKPIIIVSNNKTCEYSDQLNYVPISNTVTRPDLPIYVGIYPNKRNGLQQNGKPCYICCANIGRITKYELQQYLGELTEEETEDMNAGLCVALDLFFEPNATKKVKEYNQKVEEQEVKKEEPKKEEPKQEETGIFLKTPVFGIGLDLEAGMYMLQLVKKK